MREVLCWVLCEECWASWFWLSRKRSDLNFVPPASLQMPLERVLATCALFSDCVKVIDGLEAKCSNLLQPASVTHLSFGHGWRLGQWMLWKVRRSRWTYPPMPWRRKALHLSASSHGHGVSGVGRSAVACLIPDRMSNKILDMPDQTPEKNTIITCQMPDKNARK